jgi:hypothetical protein
MENDMKKCWVIVIDKQYTETIFGNKLFEDKASAVKEAERLAFDWLNSKSQNKFIDGYKQTIKVVQEDMNYIRTIM